MYINIIIYTIISYIVCYWVCRHLSISHLVRLLFYIENIHILKTNKYNYLLIVNKLLLIITIKNKNCQILLTDITRNIYQQIDNQVHDFK